MNYETLAIRVDERGVAYVQLNVPEKRNALSGQMIADLTDMAQTLGAQTNTRAVVLSGAGKVFCAGGDLNWMQAQIAAQRATRIAEARKLAEMLRALNEMPTALIGRIHGGAFGGGIGLACVCDVAIAEQTSKFALSETKLGLIPATIGPYVLARMGEANARRVFMSARIFDASEAVNLRVIARSVASAELDAAIEREIEPYLCVAPPSRWQRQGTRSNTRHPHRFTSNQRHHTPPRRCLGRRRSRPWHRGFSQQKPTPLAT